MAVTGLLRYPYEAITQTTDYLQIQIFRYQRNNTGSNPYLGGPQGSGLTENVSNLQSQKAKVLEPGGVIILPMPSNIQDSNSVSYDADSMNQFAAEGALAVQNLMTAGGAALSDFIQGKSLPEPSTQGGNVLDDIKQKISDYASDDSTRRFLNANLAAAAVNVFGANVSLNSLLARSEGKILNPNMELLFNNVTLRTFRFSFKLAPRDQNESTAVKSIIRTFKKNMAPKKSGTNGLFLDTPNMFKLTYRKGNQNHPFLHRFKDCALSDMSVQYTGDNVYATYADGTPVSMILNLTFKELIPIYNEDYNTDDDGESFEDGKMIYGTNTNGSTPNNSKNIEGVGF